MKNFALSQLIFPRIQNLLNGQNIYTLLVALCNKLTIHYLTVLKVFNYQIVFLTYEDRIR